MFKNPSPRLFSAFAAFTLLASTSAHAADLTWDTTIVADGTITDGSGTWTTGAGNWNDGATSVGINWANSDDATFGGGTVGTAGTVTLGGDVTVGTLFFTAPFAGAYILDLDGNTLTANDLNTNMGASDVFIDNGTIDFGAGNKTLNLTSTGTLTISALITGTGNITKAGAGNLNLTNDLNSFTGNFSVSNSRTVSVSSIGAKTVNSAAGAGSSLSAANNAALRYTGSGHTTDRDLRIGNTRGIIEQDGTGALIFTGDFFNTSGNTNTNILDLRGTNTDANEIQGVIADDATGDDLILQKNQAGTWVLSGANTYEGSTSVNDGILIAGSAAALGAMTGSTTVANGASLDVQADIGTEALSITGTGDGGIGALSTSTGTGTVGGLVTMTANASIGGAGTLNVGGAIDGAFALTKIGAGTTTLSGANTYTGTTTLAAGVLQADAVDVAATSGALGNGGDITFTGGTLQYTATTAGIDYSDRITGSTTMSFDTNGEDVTLASVLAGNTGLTKLGAGQLTAQWDESYNGITTVDEGTLVLVNSSNANKNSFSTGFQINNGSTLKIEKGVGGLLINSETFTFDSAGGGTLEINGTQALWRFNTVVTTGGVQNTLGGTAYLNMQNTRDVTYVVADGSDDVDLLVSPDHERGSIIKQGTGTVAVTHIHNDLLDTNTITIEGGVFEVAASGRIKRGNWAGAMTNDGIYRHSSTANQTLSGVVSGTGSIEQTGSGTLTLTGANTYTGDTTVTGGTLSLGDGTTNSGLADAADLIIGSGAVVNLNFTGTDTVDELFLGGYAQADGTWGAKGSGATYINDTYFTGTGTITVTTSGGAFSEWAALAGATGDPDANDDPDTLVNILEFAFGTDPLVSDANALTVAGGVFTVGTPAVDTTFSPLSVKARFIRLVDYSTSGITYTAQFSNDLSFWQDVDGSTGVRITGTSAQGDYEVVDVDYPLFLTNGKKAQFFRLSINDVNSGSVEP